MTINWIRISMAILVILAIAAIVLPAYTAVAMPKQGSPYPGQGQGGSGQYCINYCQANYQKFGSMGECMKWCKSGPIAG